MSLLDDDDEDKAACSWCLRSDSLSVKMLGLEVKTAILEIDMARKKSKRSTRSTTKDTFFHSKLAILSESVSTNLFSNLSMEFDNLNMSDKFEVISYCNICNIFFDLLESR